MIRKIIPKKFRAFTEKGFTLLELMVVFSVISVLATIGVAAFSNYNQTQILQNAKTELISNLIFAKSRSLSQVKPSNCPSNSTLSGYKVSLNLGGSTQSYDIFVVCSNVSYTLNTKSLPKSITFGSYPTETTSTSFFFPILTNGVVGDGTIVLRGYGRTQTIIVDSIGTIR